MPDILPTADAEDQIRTALTMLGQQGRLPQFKGSGAPKGPDRERAMSDFASALIGHLESRNIHLCREPVQDHGPSAHSRFAAPVVPGSAGGSNETNAQPLNNG